MNNNDDDKEYMKRHKKEKAMKERAFMAFGHQCFVASSSSN